MDLNVQPSADIKSNYDISEWKFSYSIRYFNSCRLTLLIKIVKGGKMKYVLIICFLLLASGALSQKVERNPIRFLALGDSYTIGEGVAEEDRWPNQLVEALKIKGIKTVPASYGK